MDYVNGSVSERPCKYNKADGSQSEEKALPIKARKVTRNQDKIGTLGIQPIQLTVHIRYG